MATPGAPRWTAAARLRALALAALAGAACGGPGPGSEPPPLRPGSGPGAPPSVVLITLDTARADHLGSYGAPGDPTPALDALAARGVRWARAITPAPLTLPAHATLLTGLDPPAHGVRENGTAALPAGVPILAETFAAAGYRTAAFVSSRVLDRRFGLDRGFEVYDDVIPAERMGEYGYPERDAERVTAAALAWLAELPVGPAGAPPFFLWVHYYDPHAPYLPPDLPPEAPAARRYAGEIAHADRWIGRLLAAIPGGAERALVAAAGDHGEMLGEHGEPSHGLFLYRSALEVPLIVAGPGVPAGAVVGEPVSIRELAPALLRLPALAAAAGFAGGAAGEPETGPRIGLAGPGLPGLPGFAGGEAAAPIYSEARLPAGAYGWSPLAAVTEGRWRLVVAPRPELYDFVADPAESDDQIAEEPEVARRLGRRLSAYLDGLPARAVAAPAADEELTAELAALGYLSGSAPADARPGRGLDPKDGVALLARFEAARGRLERGDAAGAAAELGALVRASPGNLPFLTLWGRALFTAGRREEAIAAYRAAVEAAPALDLARVNLGDACLEAGRPEEARRELARAVELNPGHARAWGRLAEIELAAGRPAEARRLLAAAVEAGAASASLLTRLAALELEAGDPAAARGRLAAAVALEPAWAPAWLALGRLELERGDVAAARAALARAAAAAPGTRQAAEAARLLTEVH